MRDVWMPSPIWWWIYLSLYFCHFLFYTVFFLIIYTSCEFFLFFIFFFGITTSCRILVHWSGIKTAYPAVKAQSLNHWTPLWSPCFLSWCYIFEYIDGSCNILTNWPFYHYVVILRSNKTVCLTFCLSVNNIVFKSSCG